MNEMTYKQGNTVVYVDKEKVVVKNESGKHHVETNVDQIFGLGEYKKLQKVAYVEKVKNSIGVNPLARPYEMISGYIPQRALDDLKEYDSLPGINEHDLMEKYFK